MSQRKSSQGLSHDKNPKPDLTARLKRAATQEFLEYGYEKASLRKICARAGVTTGALYFAFKNKEDLFEHIVGDTVLQLEKLSQEMVEEELIDSSVGVENEKRLLEFIWKHREVMMILFQKSKGTEYEDFLEDMTIHLEGTYEKFFRKYGNGDVDRELISILVKMKRQSYIELITGDYTLERTLELAEKIGWYADGGFECLMKRLNSDVEQQNNQIDDRISQRL